MARVIRMGEAEIKGLYQDFFTYLKNAKLVNGKVNFQKQLGVVEAKAELHFTEKAWMKMQHLVQTCDKEIAWHGTAFRATVEGVEHAYLIEDILMYPQTVTPSTVDMDTTEYAKWIQENYEDERMGNIHMQGHSHVNMGVSPSGTDISHQEEILGMLGPENFYIFVIWNKRGDKTISIFDNWKNIQFETADVKVVIDGDAFGLQELDADVEKLVKKTGYTSNYGSGYGNNGYYGGYNAGYNGSGSSYGGSGSQSAGSTYHQKSNETTVVNGKKEEPAKKSSDKKSGKKKRKEHKRFYILQGSGKDDPDDDEPYCYED